MTREFFTSFFKVAFLCVFGVLIIRTVTISLGLNSRIKTSARTQFKRKISIKGPRGNIYDRNGREMAVSLTSQSVFVDPKFVKNIHETAKILSRTLSLQLDPLKKKLKKYSKAKKRFVWIKRKTSFARMKRLEKKIKKRGKYGIYWMPEFKRVYPHNKVAAHLMGYVSTDGEGLDGVEKSFDDTLKGSKKDLYLDSDAFGRVLYSGLDEIYLKQRPGTHIYLTVDLILQHLIEADLTRALKEHKAKGAGAIVMNSKTGEIYAFVQRPGFNINRFGRYSNSVRRDRLISDSFEPGSVVKPFIIASAIDSKLIKPEQTFSYHKGKFKVSGHVINDVTKKFKKESINIEETLKYSSNIGMAQISKEIGPQDVLASLKSFGLFDKTGISLPGESKGFFLGLKKGDHLTPLTLSFGQGFSSTPIQIVTAFSKLVSDQNKIKPYFVSRTQKRELSSKNRAHNNTAPFFKDAHTADTVNGFLRKVISSDGSANKADPSFVEVIGKTGTAQKYDSKIKKYSDKKFFSSFLGAFPADNPQVSVFVYLDEAQGDNVHGGEIAAPIFAKIVRHYYRNFGWPQRNKSNKSSSSIFAR